MDERAVSLRRATPDALGDVERLLRRNGLPVADVRANPDSVSVATVGDERVGIGGIEPSLQQGCLGRSSKRHSGAGGWAPGSATGWTLERPPPASRRFRC